MLPSLDRLAGLIERVVELVDEVSTAPPAPANRTAVDRSAPPPVPPPAPPPPQLEPAPPEPAAERGWLAFVPSPHGYTLVPSPGSLPAPGDVVELDGAAFRVLRHAPSPLPGDLRRCALVAKEEPSEPDRSFDA